MKTPMLKSLPGVCLLAGVLHRAQNVRLHGLTLPLPGSKRVGSGSEK